MIKSTYDKFLTVILIILGIGILGILGYLGYGYYEKYIVTKDTENFLNEFDQYVNDIVVEVGNGENNTTETNNSTSGGSRVRGISTNALTYKGYNVIGKIELSSVNLQYPVLDLITDSKAIEYSVAMQYGVGLNEIGNTVIIGHNYRSGLFFGSNKKLQIGDKVYITDLTGRRLSYTIYSKYTTPQEDYSYATRDTNGTREITLVTCASNNKYRLVICARED